MFTALPVFFRKAEANIDTIAYNLDSRLCKAEPLWNVFAEAGKKTLVWHWPGSAWPPTSDSPNLMVVDGTSPGSVGMAVAQVDTQFLVGATTDIKELTFSEDSATEAMAACVIEDLDLDDEAPDESKGLDDLQKFASGEGIRFLIMEEKQTTTTMTEAPLDMVRSPIKDATGWAHAPEGAKEFGILMSEGKIRRYGLVLKGENGKYEKVCIYKSKKDAEPLAELKPGIMVREIIDDAIDAKDVRHKASRSMKLLALQEDGSKMLMYVSAAMDIENDSVWHPKRLYKEVAENIGFQPPTAMIGCQDKKLITDCMLDIWYGIADWQADALNYLIETEDIDVIFSHFHAIDLQTHMFIKHLADRPFNRLEPEAYEKFMEDVYVQTDYYLGKFLHLLDEGWLISVFSDHAQVAPKHTVPILAELSGVSVPIMEELGYTVLKTDENGNKLPEIDWSKTRAVAQREGHIYLNLKGREPYGIVEPEDRYELEEEIMTDLYGYKSPETGHRVVSVALRNRDAVLLGQGGPEAGDICFWLAENYNFDHADCLSTTRGESDTSVSPIFFIAGPGVKEGHYTDRIIRQVDFAPTIAALGGVRMPAQCEGAPAYQILENEY